jgi:two-component system, chemotaxis family, sensor kinase CheA
VSGWGDVDVQRFLRLFLEEAAEHVATLESGLLALEQTPDDRTLMDGVFRAAHSIKGGSSSVGLADVSRLTHAMESLLDRMRTGAQRTTPALASLLLRSTDELRALLDAVRAGTSTDGRPSMVAAELEAALGAGPAPAAGAAAAGGAEDQLWIDEVGELDIRFRPDPGIYAKGLDPLLVLRELADRGEVTEIHADLDQLPPLAELDPERGYLGWRLRLRSSQTADELRDVFAFVEEGSEITIQAVTAAAAAAPAEAAAAPVPGREPPAEAAADGRARPQQVESSTIRVAIDKVDRLINLVGELVIAQSMISQVASHFTPDKLVRLQEAVAEMERNTRELQERVMAVRMVPVSSVFSRLPRMARDLSAMLGKQVRVELAGGETELDKSMVERLGDPLTHLVRNAIDHGIETPAERARAGKPEQGTLKVVAFHQGGNVLIQIEDDGRGLDAEKIRNKALAAGLITADEQLSPEAVQALIFRPGFSTAERVTDVSGRGVGMDVVRTNIESLNGSISLDSQAGRGTRLRISLPLTLAIIDGLCVAVADEVYIVPLVAIVQSFRPVPADVRTIAGRGEVVYVRGQVLPLLRLRRLFAVPGRQEAAVDGIVVIVENQGSQVGLLVDDIVGQAQVVIKSLETNFRRVDGVMGATIMGDGRVGLILDVQGLARLGHGPARVQAPERRAEA